MIRVALRRAGCYTKGSAPCNLGSFHSWLSACEATHHFFAARLGTLSVSLPTSKISA